MKIKKNTKTIRMILGIILVSLLINGNKVVFNVINGENNIEDQHERFNLKSSNDNWEPEIRRSVGDELYSVFIGDANNDGYNDIVTANRNNDEVSIFLWNTTSGDWDQPIIKSVGRGPTSVFIEDANNDGYNDIVTANFATFGPTDDVSILLWSPISGDWYAQKTESVGNAPRSVFIGDADNDGYNDIVTANINDDNVSIILWNPISGDWDAQITKSVGIVPNCVFIGDANNDGYNDIVTANYDSNTTSILLWNDWDTQITKTVGGGPYSVFIGDANNDGFNDLITANRITNDISIFVWNPLKNNWDPRITKFVGDGPNSVFIGDADNDGYNDIVTAKTFDDEVSIILWNTTSGDWDQQINKSVGVEPYSVFIGDGNNDGYNDIATANHDSLDVSILLWSYVTPSIGLHTPENKAYKAPMSGYYPATYGFEKSEIGTVPKGWLDFSDPECSAAVIEELGNHKNVVELYDPYEPTETNRSHLFNSFSLNSHGTVEFYMRSTKTGLYSGVCLTKGVTHLFHVMFGDQYLRTCSNVTYVNLLNVSNNQWYHIRIDFRCQSAPEYMGLNERRFKIYVDGQEFGPFIIYGNRSHEGVDRMNIWTGEWQRNYFLYVDDIGYSWDPNYDIGDNMNEGLLLSFDKNYPFNWIGYSLDGLASKAIQGNVTIPFPEDGSHTIQVFGKDSLGNIYQSGLRYFSVDTIAEESPHITFIITISSIGIGVAGVSLVLLRRRKRATKVK